MSLKVLKVVLNGQVHPWTEVNAGVHQGPIIRPILSNCNREWEPEIT